MILANSFPGIDIRLIDGIVCNTIYWTTEIAKEK